MLRGFTTICYFADDVEAPSKWYAELLGVMENKHYRDVLAAR